MSKKNMMYRDMVLDYGKDVLNYKRVIDCKEFIQHSDVSVYDHCFQVAVCCLKIASALNINVDKKALIRGALLHDYFLYDWHEKNEFHKLHGFTHASKALENACTDFNLTNIEQNMISCHMFPMNLRVPKYRESVILCIADKLCATKEVSKPVINGIKKLSGSYY